MQLIRLFYIEDHHRLSHQGIQFSYYCEMTILPLELVLMFFLVELKIVSMKTMIIYISLVCEVFYIANNFLTYDLYIYAPGLIVLHL